MLETKVAPVSADLIQGDAAGFFDPEICRAIILGQSRYRITDPSGVHFLTCTVVDWLPIFAKSEPKAIIVETLQFLQNQSTLTVFAYVVMENHLHLVARAEDLSVELIRFKTYTARRIIDLLRGEGNWHYLGKLKASRLERLRNSRHQLWQKGFHPQLIQGRPMMIQKIEYIHANPVRRGYVDHPAHWRYSSARNYESAEGLLPVCTNW